MKYSANKLALCGAAFGLTMLAACGDSNTTEVTEQTGLNVLAKGEKKPDCTKDNAGDMLYVTDSAAVYYCADGKWTTLKGEKGEKGGNGTSCTAKAVNNDIEVSCDGKPVGTLTNGTGSDGKSAYEVAKANGFKGTEAEWLASLNGESCTAEKKDDGSIEVSCNGELVGTLTNGTGTDGKSAYEIAKENDESIGDVSEWLKSLKGNPGESCTVSDTTDESTGRAGYKLTCGVEYKGSVWNGIDGMDGSGCTIDESKGNGKVVVKCGKGANEKTVTLYKAMCGTESYEPETHICYEDAPYRKGSSVYDATKETLVDLRDFQVYKTVTIGSQTWMAQSMNYNTNIKTETNSWCGGGSGTTEGDCSVYGRLYTLAAAEGACPTDWHLPSKAEWESLFAAVGGETVAGKKLKSETSDWESDGKGDDTYKFSALPAGYSYGAGNFAVAGNYAYFWSASQNEDGSDAYYVYLHYSLEKATLTHGAKDFGYSVRCLKDTPAAASN